jgi:hypothetical protein
MRIFLPRCRREVPYYYPKYLCKTGHFMLLLNIHQWLIMFLTIVQIMGVTKDTETL